MVLELGLLANVMIVILLTAPNEKHQDSMISRYVLIDCSLFESRDNEWILTELHLQVADFGYATKLRTDQSAQYKDSLKLKSRGTSSYLPPVCYSRSSSYQVPHQLNISNS